MSPTVTGITLQKNKSGLKVVGPCKCGSCSAFTSRQKCAENESLTGYASCCGGMCTSQPLCLPISKKDCDIGKSSDGDDPFISMSKIYSNNIQCKYNLDKINTLNQVINYFDKFGKSNIVAENYCMKPTKNNISKVSDTDNNWCSSWLSKTPSNIKTLAVNNYCKKYNNSKDCKCINRNVDPIYQKIKMSKNFSDSCWYVPCASDPNQLKSTDLENPICPTSYCQSIVQVLQAKDVSVKDVSGKINCNFNDNKSINKLKTKDKINDKSKVIITGSKISRFYPYKYNSIMLLTMVLIFLVLILVIYPMIH